MPNIHVKHQHDLSPEDARKRVEEIARSLKKEYKMDYAWKGNRLYFRRTGANGILELGDDHIELSIKLGMVLAPLKTKIEQSIKQNIASEMSGQPTTRLT